MKKLILLVVTVYFSVLSAFSANYKSGEVVDVSAANLGDYYLAGKDINVSSIIIGDVIAAGENVWIKDSVRGDLLIGAGKIDIDGYIGDDARLSAGEIVINSRIEGDLIVFAGMVKVTQDASIAGDVICYAGEITLYGNVGGNLISAGGEIKLKNTIGGNVEIKAGEIFFDAHVMGDMEMAGKEIILGEGASCDGSITYWSGEGEMDFSGISHSAIYDDDLAIIEEDEDWSSIVKWMGIGVIAYWIIFILSAFLVILILEYLFGNYFSQAASLLAKSWIKSFGFGMLFFIGVPVVIIILLVSIIGIPIGLFALSIFLIALLFSTTVSGITIVHYFKNKSSQEWTYLQTVAYSLLSVIILKIFFMAPFIGGILKKIVAAFVYGALMLLQFEKKETGSSD